MILILGKNGQLAQSLQEQSWGEEARVLGSAELNLAEPRTVSQTLDRQLHGKPRLVLNAAAYTAVDKAESEKELAFRVNAESVEELARWCAKNDVTLVHYSTDYVYPGTGETPWSENDATGPRNTYGASKLAGEKAITASGARAYIFRISWVVSPFGNNFVKTMLRLGAERPQLKVVADQIGSPMSALQIAELTHRAFATGLPKAAPGIYNLSSAPFTSWRDFASDIFTAARAVGFSLQVNDVSAIPSADYPTPAARPLNSRMSDHKFREAFGFGLGDWREGLNEILRRLR